MMRLFLGGVVLASALTGCVALVPTPGNVPVPDAHAAIVAWGQVLDRFVDDEGRVDFASLRDDRADLDRYIAFVAAAPFHAFPEGPRRLAHFINAYNALSMHNVLDSGIPATNAGWRKVRFFALREHTIGGRRLSLYRFENDVVRPLGEPRVHFALNCSSVSCPKLPRVPFNGDGLDIELDREARRFFGEERNFRVDPAARTVWMSEILDFYTSDFVPAHASSLIVFANRYAPQPAPLDFQVRFNPYDWTIANSRGQHE